jgi:hypothetical protein
LGGGAYLPRRDRVPPPNSLAVSNGFPLGRGALHARVSIGRLTPLAFQPPKENRSLR